MAVTVDSCCNGMDTLTETQQVIASKMLIHMILDRRFPCFSRERKQSSMPYCRSLAYYTITWYPVPCLRDSIILSNVTVPPRISPASSATNEMLASMSDRRLHYHCFVVTAVPPSRLLYFSDSLQCDIIFSSDSAKRWPSTDVTSCRMLSSSASKRCVKSDDGIRGDLPELSPDLEVTLWLLLTPRAMWLVSPDVVTSSVYSLEGFADCSHRRLLNGKMGVGGLQSARLSDSRGRLTSSSALSRLRHPKSICQVFFYRYVKVPVRALGYRGADRLLMP